MERSNIGKITNENLDKKMLFEDDDDNKSTDLNENTTKKEGFLNHLNIFVEIYNNGVNQSDCFISMLEEKGANIVNKINKNTNLIIFKEGRKKVIQKALDYEIKLINPLWIHDCKTENSCLPIDNYRIKKTYTELLFDNRKRNFNDIVLNSIKSLGTPIKRRKLERKNNSKDSKTWSAISNIKTQSEALNTKCFLDKIPSTLNQNNDNIEYNVNSTDIECLSKSSVFGNNLKFFDNKKETKKQVQEEPNKKQINDEVKIINTEIKIIKHKVGLTYTERKNDEKLKTLNKDNLNNSNIKISKTNFFTKKKENLNSETKYEINSSINYANNLKNISVSKNYKLLSKSIPPRINQTNSKTNSKKLLMINTPSKDEKASKAFATINKAIYNDIFAKIENISNIKKTKLNLSSIDLNESSKTKLKELIKNIKPPNDNFIYLGEEYSDLDKSEYIIIKHNSNVNYFKQLKILYVSLLNKQIIHSEHKIERKFVKFNYFADNDKKKKILNVDDYVVKISLDYEKLEKLKSEDNLPLKGFMVFVQSDVYSNKDSVDNNLVDDAAEKIKKEVLLKLINLLGANTVNHIRLCDICITNKTNNSNYFPPHIKILNQDFIFEAVQYLKLPDIENFKFKPKNEKYKKNRK